MFETGKNLYFMKKSLERILKLMIQSNSEGNVGGVNVLCIFTWRCTCRSKIFQPFNGPFSLLSEVDKRSSEFETRIMELTTKFPVECLVDIFCHLNGEDLLKCSVVCLEWEEFIGSTKWCMTKISAFKKAEKIRKEIRFRHRRATELIRASIKRCSLRWYNEHR